MPQITSVVVINVDPERLKKEESSIDSSEVSKEDFTEGGLWGWLAVLGAFLTFFAPLGLMNSFGSFQVILNLQTPKAALINLVQEFYSSDYLSNYSETTIAFIGTLNFAILYIEGIVIGPIFDSYGLKVRASSHHQKSFESQ